MLGRIALPAVRKSLSYSGKINILTVRLLAKEEYVVSDGSSFPKFFLRCVNVYMLEITFRSRENVSLIQLIVVTVN
jgi:hypothetical protein